MIENNVESCRIYLNNIMSEPHWPVFGDERLFRLGPERLVEGFFCILWVPI